MNIFKKFYMFLLRPLYTQLEEQGRKAEKINAAVEKLEDSFGSMENRISNYDGMVQSTAKNTTAIGDLTEAIASLEKRLELYGKESEDLAGTLLSIKENVRDSISKITQNDVSVDSLKRRLDFIEKDIGVISNDCMDIKKRISQYSAFDSRLEQNEKDIVRVVNTINRYHDNAYLDTMDYLQFENRFRGTRERIMESQKQYIKYFKGRGNVVDIGCGRGEFLELLSAEGVPAIGVDVNKAFIHLCESKSFRVVCEDAIQYIRRMPKKADGIFCSQMAEHISKAKLLELCRVCYSHMEEGAYIVFETPNASSLFTMANGFYIDPTHDRPVHYLLFQYFLEISGFKDIKIVFSEESGKGLPHIPHIEGGHGCCNAEEMNRAIDGINRLLFSSQDYAIIAKR